MEQREEERTRGMDTRIMSGRYHFNVDDRCGWYSLVTTIKSCRRKIFGIYSGILRLTHHHLKQEVHRLPREALAPPFGDGIQQKRNTNFVTKVSQTFLNFSVVL